MAPLGSPTGFPRNTIEVEIIPDGAIHRVPGKMKGCAEIECGDANKRHARAGSSERPGVYRVWGVGDNRGRNWLWLEEEIVESIALQEE